MSRYRKDKYNDVSALNAPLVDLHLERIYRHITESRRDLFGDYVPFELVYSYNRKLFFCKSSGFMLSRKRIDTMKALSALKEYVDKSPAIVPLRLTTISSRDLTRSNLLIIDKRFDTVELYDPSGYENISPCLMETISGLLGLILPLYTFVPATTTNPQYGLEYHQLKEGYYGFNVEKGSSALWVCFLLDLRARYGNMDPREFSWNLEHRMNEILQRDRSGRIFTNYILELLLSVPEVPKESELMKRTKEQLEAIARSFAARGWSSLTKRELAHWIIDRVRKEEATQKTHVRSFSARRGLGE